MASYIGNAFRGFRAPPVLAYAVGTKNCPTRSNSCPNKTPKPPSTGTSPGAVNCPKLNR